MTNPLKVRNFQQRKHRRVLRDPSIGLFRTHVFTTAATDIDPAAVFGNSASRSQPVTFAFTLSRSGAASGLVFEVGSSTRGVAVYLSGADLGVAAGTGSGTAGNGVHFTLIGALPAAGQDVKFVLQIFPAIGRVKLYQAGRLVVDVVAAGGTFNGEWTDTDHGAVGDKQGTVNDRVPGGSQGALTNATLVGALSVYAHQGRK